jgi:predicted peptidase
VRSYAILIALFLAAPLSAAEPEHKSAAQTVTFETDITYRAHLNYLLYLPEKYSEDDKKWPLMIFLHGSGERGSDVNQVKLHGPPKVVEKKKDFPFILIAPQCPTGESWDVHALDKLLDDALTKYRVDTDRIYLTGLSLGGGATWRWASTHPERFAAIIPIAGFGDPKLGSTLKHVPVWAFHGRLDTTVKVAESEKLVEAVKEVGGNARLTIYPLGIHDVWTETYDNPEIYKWLLEHKRWSEAGEKKGP